MIQLLFSVLGLQVALVLVLLFKTPLRKVAILGLDRLKRGRGPIMVKTVAATVMVVLGSSGYSIFKINNRSNELGQLTPTDQVLASRHLLEASLMGTFSLFSSVSRSLIHLIGIVVWNWDRLRRMDLTGVVEDDPNELKLAHSLT